MITGIPLSSIRVLLPVKAFAQAKSRLDLPAEQRAVVARRLFAHTLDVTLQCVRRQQVFVMTNDPSVRRAATARRAQTLEDPAHDLNRSLELALATLRQRFPDDTLAVLVADLPRLTAPVLTTALLNAASSLQPRHVVDQHGTGTTFVSLPPRIDLPMLFGPGSAQRFAEVGAAPMLFPPPAITHDLDLLNDLNALPAHQKEHLCPSTPSP
ncbi:hypothetical protein CFH99_24615 [Nocardioides aromaticivorans]|uniref:2-phospho-L-lactate guanylyltransferase n=1 Tax=Nocardioides aromaticivorans TaxID=200618 RepID=A0ABX7PT53_9ACTN|nr:NTP transferase domain-containing protein [Nocardioides aromaticivorans]QSR28810.1 hypothetical protein CFH99_24615 [Nocardioides aromaticivorans]